MLPSNKSTVVAKPNPQYITNENTTILAERNEVVMWFYDGILRRTENETEAFTKVQGESYFIKQCQDGQHSGRLLNPFNGEYVSGDQFRLSKHAGRKLYEFRKVSKACYDYYMLFLTTGNSSYILNAERSLSSTGG